ncbi:hypothetical protein BaRGS_00006023 [Batillaria attramentaria]|uniref:Globin n=1 Tax=Batillaria attramentaria TaxID=370345 RepID=A0ABD0LUI8_9CAEN
MRLPHVRLSPDTASGVPEASRVEMGIGFRYLAASRLFELQSEFKKFFRRMMTQTETGEYDFDWNKLGSHANIVMTALDNAVECLGDSSYLSKGLVELGERHRFYNIKPEMVPYMWPAVRDALKQALGTDFTVETELAWKHVFDYIVSKMAVGMRKPVDDASNNVGGTHANPS